MRSWDKKYLIITQEDLLVKQVSIHDSIIGKKCSSMWGRV